jgi:hypothetical protein
MYPELYLLAISPTELISWLALCAFGTAALVSLFSFRHTHLSGLKRLSLLWILLFLIDVVGNYMREMNLTNHWLYNIYDWIYYMGLAFLYYHQLQSPLVKTIIKIFLIVFPVFIVIDTVFIESIYKLQGLVIVLGGNFVIFTAAAYLQQLYRSNDKERITRDPWFWFSVAFIIYFAATVPYLGMFNYILELYPDFAGMYYYYIYISFTLVLHLLMIKGFLCRLNYQK